MNYLQWSVTAEGKIISAWVNAQNRITEGHNVMLWERVAEECEQAWSTLQTANEIRRVADATKLHRATIHAALRNRDRRARARAEARKASHLSKPRKAARIGTNKRQDEILSAVNCAGIELPELVERFSGVCSSATIYRDVHHLRTTGLLIKSGDRLTAKEQGA